MDSDRQAVVPLNEDLQQLESVFPSEDIDLFLKLFAGRGGVYAYEVSNYINDRGFISVRGALTPEEIKKHLAGEITLAVYPLRENNTVKFMVVDIDVSKKILLEYESQPDQITQMIKQSQLDANRLRFTAEALGMHPAIEDSGHRGRHCWFFFQTPLKAEHAIRLAKIILGKTGSPGSGLTREIFPSKEDMEDGQGGSLIRLPLGRHTATGKRGLFVDEAGVPYPDQADYLHQINAN